MTPDAGSDREQPAALQEGHFWDEEPCPRDECGGELQFQGDFNVMCLECEEAWTHVTTPEHEQLVDIDWNTVTRRPRVATDGGQSKARHAAELEAEAESLVELFNDAADDASPELEWFAMHADYDNHDRHFVLQAPEYIDRAGLAALRDAGRTVGYIEGYLFEDEVYVQIDIEVEGEEVEL